MSDHQDIPGDSDQPREGGRFRKGVSGNPRGRPPKPRVLLVPSQLRRTLISILDEKMDASPPSHHEMTKFEALMRNLISSAAAGKPTALNHLMRLLPEALHERVQEHPSVMVAEYLRCEEDKIISDFPDLRQQTDHHLKVVKGRY